MKTLEQIWEEENLQLDDHNQKGTSKFSAHPYAEKYDELFLPWREKQFKLLEIGALYGASTIIWDKYFPKADITVVDIEDRNATINTQGRIDSERTKLIFGDAYTEEFANNLGTFDIINDDGPHTLEAMRKCIELYFPKLNSGGFLIIEDIPQQHWVEEFESMLPGIKTETIDYTSVPNIKKMSDSRIFIAWK